MTCAANGARTALTIESCENASTSLLFFRSLFRTSVENRGKEKLLKGKIICRRTATACIESLLMRN